MVADDDKTCVIDRSKLRKEREGSRHESQKEQQNFRIVNAIYFDCRKDANQIVVQGPNGKHYRSVQLKKHHTVVGEPGSYYLIQFFSRDGKGRTIAQKLFNSIRGAEWKDKLAIVGTDWTACITEKYRVSVKFVYSKLACRLENQLLSSCPNYVTRHF